MKNILVLPGDGIGPEVVRATCSIIEWFALHRGLDVNLDHQLLHGACYDRHGVFLLDETLADAAIADAILVGTEGGPQWDSLDLPGKLEDKSGLMWREEIARLHLAEYPDVRLEHMLADNCAMQLMMNPARFDVIVTDNLFGDILSDQGGAICGSLGMLPSASLGPLNEAGRGCALYEPVHGSAPDIAGHNVANPLGTVLSFAMMLRLTFGRESDEQLLVGAIERALAGGARTLDIAIAHEKVVTTRELCEAIIRELEVMTR